MRGGVAVQRDHPRGSMLCRRMGKEPLGGGYITPFAQEKINRSTLSIDRAIEVNPLALYLDVGLIHAPGVAHSPRILVPALFKVRHVALHPAQDGRMSQGDAALGHHLDQVTGAELECQVPPHAKDNNFLVEMPTPEEFLRRGRFCHSSRYRRKPSLSSLHQNRTFDLPPLQHLQPGEPGVFHGTHIHVPCEGASLGRSVPRVETLG
jgi:hypothetical protein